MILVGQPNVGKSALFASLTGVGAIVSNYPGTTVTITRGTWRLAPDRAVVVKDTPGAYSLLPITDEERIARDCLFEVPPGAVLHVVDAKNLERALPTTLELLDAALPVILVVNMVDEARAQGFQLDSVALARRLGCPVVETVAIDHVGLDRLREEVVRMLDHPPHIDREPGRLWIEEFGPAVTRLAEAARRENDLPPCMSTVLAAAAALRGGRNLAERAGFPEELLAEARREVQGRVGGIPAVAGVLILRARARVLLEGIYQPPRTRVEDLRHRLGLLLAHPVWGLPVLIGVLYLGFYLLVGTFAAGTVVGFLEEDVFGSLGADGTWEGGYVNPLLDSLVRSALPWDWLAALFVGTYGIFTLGITYALALVLPVVGAFFVVFSLVEDSGYFPRLALLCDRVFKQIGLNGRAVITMVLGLGCATMATVTTRTMETRRERFLATMLLVLAIPCSAQLGLISALLAARGFGLWASYVGCLVAIFFLVGWLAARILPGGNATFHMAMPPLRVPRIRNVLGKTWLRLKWYFLEVVPLFLWASVILWAFDLTGALGAIKSAMEPAMGLLGLPVSAAESFLVGFFRRDFGAAGLFQLATQEGGQVELGTRPLLVGSVTLTLFVPCVASFMMMCKERGWRAGLAIFTVVTAFAFAAGAGLNQLLLALGWE